MPLALIMVLLLVVALGLVQAWTIWFLKREVQRLEFRLGEALDDEDLLEFQERLRALLTQAKDTARGLAETVDKRKAALELTLEKVKEAEKSLALRLLAKSAADFGPAAAKTAPKTQPRPEAKPKAEAKSQGKAKPVGPAPSQKPVEKTGPKTPAAAVKATVPRPKAGPPRFGGLDEPKAGSLDADLDAESAEERTSVDARRSYLSRPATPAPSRYQKIYDLSDQGLALEQIAKQSGLLAGEIDLILNLRRKAPPAD